MSTSESRFSTTPSAWVREHASLLPTGGRVLDIACGGGRHTRYLHTLGHPVTAVDKTLDGVADLDTLPAISLVQADLETGFWPFAEEYFAGVVVTNYLHRPLLPVLPGALAPGGLLIYATFALGNEKYGRPRNPDFLLQPDELLDTFGAELEIVAFEQIETPAPNPAVRQKICARRPA